jgi:serine phosphatase RsbU (regulator of sigma subunit)
MVEGRGAYAVEQEKEPSKKRPWWKRLWGWTGFGEKKLWDWLQLLSALAIPVVLTVAGFWFAVQQQEREAKRAALERELEDQRTQDAALQIYFDQMTQLMLERNLRNSEEGSEVRTLARARTLTVLRRLDSDRKRSLLLFLYEAKLINKEEPVVNLLKQTLPIPT